MLLLSSGNNLSGLWNVETSNKAPRSSGYLSINVAQYTEAFTAPSIVDSALSCAFMIDDTAAGGANGVWTLTLQEDPTGAFSGGESDVATGTLDMGVYNHPDGDSFAYIALSSGYQFTTTAVGAYRWKIQTTGASQNRLRQSVTSTTNWCYLCFDNRTAVPGANDLLFVGGVETFDANVTLGGGTTGVGYVWTHALCILNGGQVKWADDGNDYKVTLEGSIRVENGGQLGAGVAMINGGSGTFEWAMGAYADGDFGLYTGVTGKPNLVGVTRTINTMYASGDGTIGTPLKTTVDIGLAVDERIEVLATEGFEETEFKYLKSGSHASGWVLSDTIGGAESGLSNTHSVEAPILSLTRNLRFQTDDSSKGFFIDDNKGNTTFDGYGLGDDSIWSYVLIKNFYDIDMIDCLRTGVVFEKYTNDDTRFNQKNKIGRTHRYNIFTDSIMHDHSLDHMYVTTASNSTEQDSWFTVTGTNALSMKGGPMGFKRCMFWDCNYDNESLAGGIGRCPSPLNLIFSDCRVEVCQQTSSINIRGNVTNVQFINCEFGTLFPSPRTFKLFAPEVYLFTLLYKNCIFNDTTFGTVEDMQGGLYGSFLDIHKYDETDNKHFRYETYGIHQSTGAGLDDTTTRTAGHLAYRFQSEDGSAGIFWEFFIPAPAISSVSWTGFLRENAAFFGDSEAELKVELFLPGSTSADDTYIFSDFIDEADKWDVASVFASYTGSISSLAKIRITAKTETVGAYAYVADLYNGTNEFTNLNTWEDGRPASIMMQDFANPASVWTTLVLGNTPTGSFGEAVMISRGLSQHNFRMSITGRDIHNKATECELRIFENRADALADTNPYKTWTMDAEYVNQLMTEMVATEDL